MYAIGVMAFIVFCVVIIWLWSRSRDFERDAPPTIADALNGWAGYQGEDLGLTRGSKIVYNGREFSSLAEMHPDDRKDYQETVRKLTSAPKAENNLDAPAGDSAQIEILAETPEDAFERLRRLKDMKVSGLITEEDYDTKKAEILERM